MEFAEILLPGLALKSISILPLAFGLLIAIRHLRSGRMNLYTRNLFGSLAASVVVLGLLWGSLFGVDLSSSSTAGLIFLFAPIYSLAALLVGYLIGVAANRGSRSADANAVGNPLIPGWGRTLIWIPVLILVTVMFGITRYSFLNNDLSVAEHASRPETLRYVLEKAARRNADSFGVPLFLAQNPNAPSDVLERLSKSNEPQVRAFVAGNINTPMSVVASLQEDCADYVRKAARGRLKESGINSSLQSEPGCGAAERRH